MSNLRADVIRTWCLPPKADADFVWHMEDVLQVYQLPYYPGNKEGHIPTRSASEGPMKSSESRRGSPLDD